MLSLQPRQVALLISLATCRVRTLGDVEGHEFHGNQYTSGAGGGNYPSDLTKIGEAKGSNPGGLHVDASGQKWYVKQYGKPEQAASEHVANQIYEGVGAKVPESALGPKGELATKWLPDAGKTLGQTGLTKENANAILDHYAADVFVANWDAVGTGHDNVLVGKNGAVTRVDQGGTLLYRAQGGLKPEAGLGKIGEWNTLADPGMNRYYSAVFKTAGVKSPDDLGARAIKQIDAIKAARPAGGWKAFVEKAAPNAPATFHAKVGAMLESRQKGLEEKRAALALKTLEWNEELHPRGPDGKFEDGGGGTAKGKKAPKAPPVPIELKHKAYEMVKGGKSFKATAAELGMTQGQVAGHVWKVDQKKKEVEKALKAKSAEAPAWKDLPTVKEYEASIAAPKVAGPQLTKSSPGDSHGYYLDPATGLYHVKNEATGEHITSFGSEYNAKYKAETLSTMTAAYSSMTPKSTGSATHTETKNSAGEKIKTEASTGHITVSKDGKTATYEWKEKTKENSPHAKENLGKYAYFKDGVQVSGAFPKSEHAEAAGSINQGKGPSVGATASVSAPYQHVKDDFVAHVEKEAAPHGGSWPVTDSVNRVEGSNYPKQMDKIGNEWATHLTTKEVSAIKGYTGSSYHGVNAALRNGSPTSASASAKAIENALAKAPAPPPPDLVWRGVSHSGAAHLVQGLSNGDVIKLPGFQSTSINPKFAHNWSSGGTVFEIKPAAGAYVKVISSHSHEHEFLLPHNARYAVRGITHVHIEGKKRAVVQLEMLHH